MCIKPRKVNLFKAGDRIKFINSRSPMVGEWLVVDERSFKAEDRDTTTTPVVNVRTGRMWSVHNWRKAVKCL